MGLAEIWAAIQSVTQDPRDRRTLLYATAAESGAQPIPQGGGGPGMGYYQISSGQGVTEAQANDPVQATQLFYDHWSVHACAALQGQLWQTNPDEAANNAAQCAERPAGPYSPAQRATERSLWQKVTGNAPPTLPPLVPGGPPLFTPGLGLGNPIDFIGGKLTGALGQALKPIFELLANHTFWIRALLVVGGFAGILIGVKGLAGIDNSTAIAAAAAA